MKTYLTHQLARNFPRLLAVALKLIFLISILAVSTLAEAQPPTSSASADGSMVATAGVSSVEGKEITALITTSQGRTSSR